MSYILDALRKAEHERNVGDAPKLEFPPLSDKTESRGLGIWVIVLVLGATVGVLGAMQLSQYLSEKDANPAVSTAQLSSSQGNEQPASAPVKKVTTAPPPEIRAVPEPDPAPESAPEPPSEPAPQKRAVQVSTPQGPVKIEMPVTPAPAGKEAPASAQEIEETPQDSASASAEAPPQIEVPSPAELAAELENTDTAEPVETDVQPPPDSVEPEPELEPEIVEERLMSYLGLPPGTRNNIGELAMNAHVYSSTPGRGFVMINGRRYGEGDELEEGPVVEEIRRDGAVMSYRGERFLLPVPR